MQKKLKLLVHVCCAVDAVYSLKFIKNSFKYHSVKAFFYNPNIVPYAEYYLRAIEAERATRINGLELIMGEYDNQLWQHCCKNFYFEPEKGDRCYNCHKILLNETAKFAASEGFDCFTTTLFMSPQKNHSLVQRAGEEAEQLYSLKFLKNDFKKNDGYLKTRQLVRQYNIYSQKYCGCASSYTLRDNLFVNMGFRSNLPKSQFILPASIEARNSIYFLRNFLENRSICVSTQTSKTLFWNIKRFCAKINGAVVMYPKAVLVGNSCSTNGVFRTRVVKALKNGTIKTEKIGVEFYYQNQKNRKNCFANNTTPKVIFSSDIKLECGDLLEVDAETEVINSADSVTLFARGKRLNDACENVRINVFEYQGFHPRGFSLEMAIEKIEHHFQKLKEGKIWLTIFSHIPIQNL